MKDNNSAWRNIGAWALLGAGAYLAIRTVYDYVNRYQLKGKVVLITGGSRGLGLVLARALAAEGAKLALCSRTASQLGQAQHELEAAGAEVVTFCADVSERDQVKQLITDVVDHYGRIDVLVNNAGIIQVGPEEAMSIEDYEEAMKVNFWSALYAIKEVVPHFKKQGEGRIVNITSIGGKIAVPHLLPYTASKFALVGLSEGLHAELSKDNIKVTTVVPNLMRTGSPRNATIKGDHEAEYAWFKLSGSSALLSSKAEAVARRIVQAIEYEETEVILSVTARTAVMLQGIAPGLIPTLMSLANAILPVNVHGGDQARKGYEAESEWSIGPVGSRSDKAALLNNQF
ncbi:SDR family NAD(P)-dependent oxidoreductase [Pseudochryseolinea flava]|uniref:Ketoacyl reductase n=1 Tax=Pseudochryseolinea flava TaxID=2059302 RepID=A0A364Y0C8_9BACT|nr:SDR family oxidoreductase [Pseudochryseolinea flava]RAW00119.1 ketoacyl reductase [Pseudochryseolinea flava]